MTRFMRLLLVTAALLAASLVVACSSDSDDNGDNGGSDGQPDATEPADGDNGDNGDGGDDGNGSSDGDGGDITGELRDLADRFGDQEFKIEFNYSSSTGGVVDDEGTMTLYWKPPDGWRMDIGSDSGDATMITQGGTSYICSADGGEAQCFESPVASDSGVPFLSLFTDPNALTAQIDSTISGGDVDVNRSSRNIAGVDATCYEYSGTIDGEAGEAEYCFGDNGMLLALVGAESDAGSTSAFSLEATNVSTSVSSSDLEPPYPILDLGDLGDLIP